MSDNLAYQKCFVLQRLLYSDFLFTAILPYVYWMNRWVLVWIHFNVCKGDTQTKTLKRAFADHIQSAFSSIHVFFEKKQKVIMSRFPTGIFWFVFNDWHHSWHNNGLRRLTGLWRKKSQRDLAEGMLGMLVQCIKALYAVLTVEALCVLSW